MLLLLLLLFLGTVFVPSTISVIIPGLCPEFWERDLSRKDPAQSFFIIGLSPVTNKVMSYVFNNTVNDFCFFNYDFPSITFCGDGNSTCQTGILTDTPDASGIFQSEFLWKNKADNGEKRIVEMLEIYFFQSEGFIWSCWDLNDTAGTEHEEALIIFAREIKRPWSNVRLSEFIEDTIVNLRLVNPRFTRKLIDSIVWANETTLTGCSTGSEDKKEKLDIGNYRFLTSNLIIIIMTVILLISAFSCLLFCSSGSDNLVHPQ